MALEFLRLSPRFLALAALIAAPGAAGAQKAGSLPSQPRSGASVVLYVMDTVRADRLGLYGYPLATSPKLDRLAHRGLVFWYAYAPGPSTSWSVPALLASRYPVEMVGKISPRPAERVLAEAFQAASYATACLQANFGLIPELGYGRGFDRYRVLRKSTPEGYRYWTAREVNDEALSWIASLPREQPFFFYTQVMDAHFPYDPPPRFAGRLHAPDSPAAQNRRELLRRLAETGLSPAQLEVHGRNLESMNPDRYDEALAYLTQEFVRFVGGLRRLGRLDDTFVVLTADHGEPLGEHESILHGTNLHEEQVRVPLIVWGPGVTAGRDDETASLIDLAPTLLDLVGLSPPPSFRGRSLAGPEPPAPRVAVGEMGPGNFGRPASQFARQQRWKLIAYPDRTQLFDLEADPKETRDVSREHPRVTAALAAEIARRLPPVGTTVTAAEPTSALPADVKRDLDRSLRALGYVE